MKEKLLPKEGYSKMEIISGASKAVLDESPAEYTAASLISGLFCCASAGFLAFGTKVVAATTLAATTGIGASAATVGACFFANSIRKRYDDAIADNEGIEKQSIETLKIINDYSR